MSEKYVQEVFLGEETLGEKYMSEKYVQEEFLAEESLREKYMVKSMRKKSFWVCNKYFWVKRLCVQCIW